MPLFPLSDLEPSMPLHIHVLRFIQNPPDEDLWMLSQIRLGQTKWMLFGLHLPLPFEYEELLQNSLASR
jgi:hypothetical protein